ncbi:unnamed protein product [Arctogadus glacialis]
MLGKAELGGQSSADTTICADICAVVANGMWDQVRVDHGKEFYLCLYIQGILSRHNLSRQPDLQTTSSRPDWVRRGCAVIEWIQGRGIPNELAAAGCPAQISEDLLPSAAVAADRYEQEFGSSLSREAAFGVDPFHTEEDRSRAQRDFTVAHPDPCHF